MAGAPYKPPKPFGSHGTVRLIDPKDPDVIKTLAVFAELRYTNHGKSSAKAIIKKLNAKPRTCLAVCDEAVQCGVCATGRRHGFPGVCIFVVMAKPILPSHTPAQRRELEDVASLVASVRSGDVSEGVDMEVDTDLLLLFGSCAKCQARGGKCVSGARWSRSTSSTPTRPKKAPRGFKRKTRSQSRASKPSTHDDDTTAKPQSQGSRKRTRARGVVRTEATSRTCSSSSQDVAKLFEPLTDWAKRLLPQIPIHTKQSEVELDAQQRRLSTIVLGTSDEVEKALGKLEIRLERHRGRSVGGKKLAKLFWDVKGLHEAIMDVCKRPREELRGELHLLLLEHKALLRQLAEGISGLCQRGTSEAQRRFRDPDSDEESVVEIEDPAKNECGVKDENMSDSEEADDDDVRDTYTDDDEQTEDGDQMGDDDCDDESDKDYESEESDEIPLAKRRRRT